MWIERPPHQPRSPGALLGCLLSSVALLGLPGVGHSQPFSETIDVRVVNVDVYVTDRKGQPVEDLTAEDFVLVVDGAPTSISHFYSLGGERSEPLTGVSTAPGPTDVERDGETGAPETAADPIHAIVYVDSYALAPPDRERILDDLELFATTQAAGGVLFQVVSHDPGLKVLTSFTESIDEVRDALARTTETPARGFNTLQAHRRALEDIASLKQVDEDTCRPRGVCDCVWTQMLALRDLYAAEVSGRQDRSRDGLAEIVRSLAGLEGRKALFYVSSGLEQYPGVDMVQYMSEVCPKYDRSFQQTLWRWDDTTALDELAAEANANRVTFYTLDAGGLRSSGTADAGDAEYRFRPSLRVSEIRRRNLESSLYILADRTGGRAVFNANAPADALNALSQDFTHYYSLGFEPQGPADGKKHRLRVELAAKHRGATLRFRQSFRDKPAEEQQIERTLTALHWEHESNPLGAQVAIGTLRETGKRRYEVPLEIRLPESALTRIGPSEPAQIRLTLAAHDLARGTTDLREKRVELPAPSEGQEVHLLSIEIDLVEGDYRFAAGIRDETGDVASYLGLSSQVPVATATP